MLWHGENFDLRKGSFKEGWEEFLLKVSRKKITRKTKCLACGLRSMCGMCPANEDIKFAIPEFTISEFTIP